MKLRSGRELPERIDKLPQNLDNLLKDRLQEFKKMFSGNPEHGKELLHIISQSRSISSRFSITDKVEEIYDINNPEKINPLLRVAGALMVLVINEPKYHDLIHVRMENFDLETNLLGNVEE
jgi:hypothetical protein